jgi:hypothetical protein
VFRKKIEIFSVFQDKPKKKSGATWTEEKKLQHVERMRKYYRNANNGES